MPGGTGAAACGETGCATLRTAAGEGFPARAQVARRRELVAQALRSEASAEISEEEQLTRAAAAGRQAAHESNS